MHMLLFGKKGHLTIWGSPIKYGDQILSLLEAVHLPPEVLVSHCKGHQQGSMEVARGNQAANRAAKRVALQNNDLIGAATLVPHTKTIKQGLTCFIVYLFNWRPLHIQLLFFHPRQTCFHQCARFPQDWSEDLLTIPLGVARNSFIYWRWDT